MRNAAFVNKFKLLKKMKNIKLFKIAAIGLLALGVSCQDDMTDNNTENKNIVEGSLKNGRLYFPNKESLSATYKDLKSKNIAFVEKYVNEKGLESLVPVITDQNEKEVIEKLRLRKDAYLSEISARTPGGATPVIEEDIYEDLDDLEEIVGDDTFAAMLNGEAEIQVADNVYKYTDVGLFVTPVLNYSNLENYLEVRQISPNLLEPTLPSVKEDFLSDKVGGELMPLANTNNKINYYISPIYTIDDGSGNFPGEGYPGNGYPGTMYPGSGGGYGGGGGGTYTPPVEPSMASIVQNLPVGEVRKPWLGNIFGTTWETDDKYESRRRVKVKFYSQNLYLVYAVGCKVKHQYKGWTGIWRKENADKLGIGINSIEWKFSHAVNYGQNTIPREVYWVDGKMYKAANNTDYTNMGSASVPTFPFSQNATVDAVIQFTSDLSGLTTAQIDKLFWETAWKQVNKFIEGQNKQLKRVAFVVDSYNATHIQYYDFSQVTDNNDVIERVFNWGVATPQFTYTFGGGTQNGTTITSYKFDFLQPTAVSVSMYGIAKKNGAWHGVKLNAK